ncbi:unnamed protein product, partial [Ectocarpus fasciculatus]
YPKLYRVGIGYGATQKHFSCDQVFQYRSGRNMCWVRCNTGASSCTIQTLQECSYDGSYPQCIRMHAVRHVWYDHEKSQLSKHYCVLGGYIQEMAYLNEVYQTEGNLERSLSIKIAY